MAINRLWSDLNAVNSDLTIDCIGDLIFSIYLWY